MWDDFPAQVLAHGHQRTNAGLNDEILLEVFPAAGVAVCWDADTASLPDCTLNLNGITPPSSRRIHPQQAMAVIHVRLAGGGKILFRDLIKPPASLHHQPGFAQHNEMPAGVVVIAAGGGCQFANRARLALAQFLKHLPPHRTANRLHHAAAIRQW